MIYSYLHQGSGAGNQLARYIAVRVKALELDTDWRMIWNPDNSGKDLGFKCQDFMNFDDSKVLGAGNFTFHLSNAHVFKEKKVVENGIDIRPYDPEFNFIQDDTVIEGEFQSELYWQDYEKEVSEWLKVEPLEVPDDVCVIGFRGGEFSLYPDLFLTREYWEHAMRAMLVIAGKNLKFEVHTDDPILAQQFFPDFKVIHDIGINWRSMRYAKYAIIANSSFFILPRWLRNGVTIAPRYWGRRNIKVWSLPQNYYKRFQYI